MCLQGKVLIADSWFGSVACALALFKYGIYCVVNVKTAHKGYPKDVMLELVGEVKGKTEADKAARKARRGKQVAFTAVHQVGSRSVTLTAGGHNKKLPLLLISTFGSMLPGDAHTKYTPRPGRRIWLMGARSSAPSTASRRSCTPSTASG